MTNPFLVALRLKEEVRERVGSMLSRAEREAAERDSHARRRERPCGITIHTGIGCDYGCVYCYIWDMGFSRPAKPYPLTPLQLVYAVASNPHVAVGEWGSLVSIGSVTEPFLPTTARLAVEYMEAIRAWLGNPIQISVKGVLRDPGLVERVAAVRPNVLVTITTLSKWRVLEPSTPSPAERLEFAGRLIKSGVSVTLFLRPIIPGITDVEARAILEAARSVGVRSVVPGTLRVTERIVRSLARVGVDVASRAVRIRGREQVPIRGRDLKSRVVAAAREVGMEVFPASCAANVWSHGQACATCRMGPCGDLSRLPRVEDRHVVEYLEQLGVRGDASVEGTRVVIRVRRGRLPSYVPDFVKNVARREVVVR